MLSFDGQLRFFDVQEAWPVFHPVLKLELMPRPEAKYSASTTTNPPHHITAPEKRTKRFTSQHPP